MRDHYFGVLQPYECQFWSTLFTDVLPREEKPTLVKNYMCQFCHKSFS